jgi:hypothetical protein
MNDKEAPEEFNLGETAKIWAAAVLAPAWYEDALREAAIRDWGARRREIILSVCFAETYLYEFVRDTFIQQPNEIYEFFPIDDRRGVYDYMPMPAAQNPETTTFLSRRNLVSKTSANCRKVGQSIRLWSVLCDSTRHRSSRFHLGFERE